MAASDTENAVLRILRETYTEADEIEEAAAKVVADLDAGRSHQRLRKTILESFPGTDARERAQRAADAITQASFLAMNAA